MTDPNIELPARRRRMDDAVVRPAVAKSGVPITRTRVKDPDVATGAADDQELAEIPVATIRAVLRSYDDV